MTGHMRGTVHILRAWGLAVLLFAGVQAARAQGDRAAFEQDASEAQNLQSRAIGAFLSGDYELSEKLLRDQLKLEPDSYFPHYNLACTLSRQGRLDEAMGFLERAVELGFSDVYQLQRDESFRPLASMDRFKRLIAGWDRVLDAQGEARLERLRATYGKAYLYERDERLRLNFATGYDEGSFADARRELAMLADWATREVFPELAQGGEGDAWVSVVLPTRKDYQLWLARTYGAFASRGFSTLGGAYSHDRKELVAQDLGGTLRHEFLHVLHFRSCTRLSQSHPVWIQEGLCSLVEDYDLTPDAAPLFTANWRTNIPRRLLKAGKLPTIAELAGTSREQFTGSRPLAFYAQARAVFLWMFQRGCLGAWYAHYTTHYKDDPSGYASIVAVTGLEGDDLERAYRAWLSALPEVPEEIEPGRASLGIEVGPGSGDGPVITSSVPSSRFRGQDERLKLRDVITHLNGQPTRDLAELIRRLSRFQPGDVVEIRFRRGSIHGVARIDLRRK
jgi:tetratricopeptide (TPR) repeat protein